MKKWCWAFLLLFLPKIGFSAITDDSVVREKTFVLHFSTTIAAQASAIVAASSPTALVLISLSTPTGWPHKEFGEIDISHIDVHVDKLAASTCTIKMGVVNFVNSSTGSITFFWTYSNQRNVSATVVARPLLAPQAFIRARITSGATSSQTDVNGTTPYILSNDVRNGSAVYQRSRLLPSASLTTPNVAPAVGDIVLEITNFDVTNSIIIDTDVWYHSER